LLDCRFATSAGLPTFSVFVHPRVKIQEPWRNAWPLFAKSFGDFASATIE
jgi:hypothetical protein